MFIALRERIRLGPVRSSPGEGLVPVVKRRILRKLALIGLITTTGFATAGGCEQFFNDFFCFFSAGDCAPRPPGSGTTQQPCRSPSWEDYDNATGDGMSAATETNPANGYLFLRGPWLFDGDPSVAHGLPYQDPNTGEYGSLENGLNIADSSHFEQACGGYYHYYGTDQTDSDDWGTATLVRTVELVSETWGSRYVRPRVQTGDMSLRTGGYWPDHPASHQNGRDVDIRYLRKNGAEGPLDLAAGVASLDSAKTRDLIGLFVARPNVTLVLIDSRSSYPCGGKVDCVLDHTDHFHVRIADPDTIP